MKSRDATVLYILVAFRFVNALCVRTFFQPDEYFQALEPAWRIAFGSDSGAWLTWEWQYQLRSSLHPALFGGVYIVLHNVLKFLHASPEISAALLVAAPKATQAVFAALGDYYTWKLALQIYGNSGGIASAALWLTVSNPWQWHPAALDDMPSLCLHRAVEIDRARPGASQATTSPLAAKNSSPSKPRLRHRYVLGGCLAVNIILGGYLSSFHQRAPLSVLHFLRHEYEGIHPDSLVLGQATPSSEHTAPLAPSGNGTAIDINRHLDDMELFALFLTPCHSTPWRSHLVYPGLHARALTCEPPIHTEPGTREREEYLDEADRFYADKDAFLATEMWPQDKDARRLLPRYIVGFEGIEEDLRRFFDRQQGRGAGLGVELHRVWEGWNGFFNEDVRRRGLLVDDPKHPPGILF
ncbi:GPI mannosyltransferase 3 [Pyricularia oryzae Y34]|uniref:Mannosyltransferase n=2 Tax=Pyricularia oryzae TaxID=318829 RepID=A0AA97P9D0_PYRO3|nr:GPI mannosyltransferase 3 [Pyricularia oryzae Y34]